MDDEMKQRISKKVKAYWTPERRKEASLRRKGTPLAMAWGRASWRGVVRASLRRQGLPEDEIEKRVQELEKERYGG